MKISKHLHSCLLVEEQGKTLLFDPGIFTYQEKALDLSKLEKLDYILITHDHPDHMHLPFLQELITKFPSAKIITNNAIVEPLAKQNIPATYEADAIISVTKVPHENFHREYNRPVVLYTDSWQILYTEPVPEAKRIISEGRLLLQQRLIFS